MKVLYFTSTGNSLHVAKQIGGELISIPRALKDNRLEFEDDKIGIVFPCYCLCTPYIIQEFIAKVTLKSPYIFAVMTYGNFSADGTGHIKKICANSGIELSYSNEIKMVDNYLPFFEMQQQIDTAGQKNIGQNLQAIVEDIHAGKKQLRHNGVLRKFATIGGQGIYRFTGGNSDKRFIIEESCNGCRVCQKVCPVENISINAKPEFMHRCIECLACAQNCPQNAIQLKKQKSRVRFRNEHVTLEEIITANNQTS